ncbi:MAG: hypothetical protein JNJ77_18515 [Planctomycetia bacterium]|nr:hypothetical protein [Planctomycetia bacterium]
MFSACLCICLMHLVSDTKTVYQLEVKVYDLKASIERVLCNPALKVLAGKPARFVVGGEEPIPNTTPVQYEPVGIIVSCIAYDNQGEDCQVDMSVLFTSKQPSTDGSLLTSQKSVRYRGKWRLNETKTLPLGNGDNLENIKVDLRLTLVKPANLK